MLMKMTCISGEKETIYSLKSGKDYYIDLDSIYLDSDYKTRGTVYKDRDRNETVGTGVSLRPFMFDTVKIG